MTVEIFYLVMVIGVSMNPTYYANDLVFACHSNVDGCGFNDLRVGDVIDVDSSKGKVVHRVNHIETDNYGNNVIVFTKGDNQDTNPSSIPEVDVVTESEYVGKIVSRLESISVNTNNATEGEFRL